MDAVITAAGLGTRLYPWTKVFKKEFLPIVKNNTAVPAIHLIIEELSSVERIFLVIQERDRKLYHRYIKKLLDGSRVPLLIVQEKQRGFGDAVLCAKQYIDEPFLLLPSDIIYKEGFICRFLEAVSLLENSYVVTVKRVDIKQVSSYGIVKGITRPDLPKQFFEVASIKEKPAAAYAKDNLITDTENQFLSVQGPYVLLPSVFDYLENVTTDQEIQLTSALEQVTEPFYAYEAEEPVYDIGTPINFSKTIFEFSKNV